MKRKRIHPGVTRSGKRTLALVTETLEDSGPARPFNRSGTHGPVVSLEPSRRSSYVRPIGYPDGEQVA